MTYALVKAVADARGLAGAARTMGLNHSTVFRRLAQIEDLAGTALFVRHRTGYAATAAGEEMVALAERMEDDVASLSRKLAGGACPVPPANCGSQPMTRCWSGC